MPVSKHTIWICYGTYLCHGQICPYERLPEKEKSLRRLLLTFRNLWFLLALGRLASFCDTLGLIWATTQGDRRFRACALSDFHNQKAASTWILFLCKPQHNSFQPRILWCSSSWMWMPNRFGYVISSPPTWLVRLKFVHYLMELKGLKESAVNSPDYGRLTPLFCFSFAACLDPFDPKILWSFYECFFRRWMMVPTEKLLVQRFHTKVSNNQ